MLYDDIAGWLHAPFKEPLNSTNWLLLILFSSTVAFGWTRVLEKVLEK